MEGDLDLDGKSYRMMLLGQHFATQAMAEILAHFPQDIELEIELTHRLWVLSFNHFGSAGRDLQKAMDFLEPLLIGLVSRQVSTEVKKGLLNRRASTKFSMCHDAGRYMTKGNSRMRPPGEVAAMRLVCISCFFASLSPVAFT